ncbi:CidA/LrgA family protein [Pseudorhodobacter sp.]|uniref:CidA/LrgA family protein n=1 Tax=Pseudorhodobacter sp. TaxID=1934400 RepID=UPI00264A2005|nr:CidA/LrgA family protein [Pseudorhodobacter sp.]MDN5786571.1 CidA/LrgA family protein [Pseudorhodobacter sp.]
MILHLAVLLAFQLIGETISRGLGLSLPGPVIGMVLLLGLFMAVPKAAAAIQPTAQGLLSHLSLLFVPAGVGIVGHLNWLGADGLPILLALAVSTALAIAIGALVFVGLSRVMAARE